MFNRKRIAELEAAVRSLDWSFNQLEKRHWELQRQHRELVDALNLVRDDRVISRYTTKGGPEQAS